MLSFIITIVKLLVIIVCVASFHEFGHFLASKLQGVGVEEFSVGFGPKIVQKKFKGTMYSLRWVPLGGYCAIEGEEPAEDGKESESSYQKKNPLQKIIILAMGVIFNFILATVIFMILYMPGNVASTKIVSLADDSVLKEAGIQEGDTITKVNGKKISLYSQLASYDMDVGEDIEVEYERDGNTYTTTVHNAKTMEGKIGISFTVDEEGNSTNVVELTGAGTSATKVGIKSGDIILSINDISTPDAQSIVNLVKNKGNEELDIKVQRGTEILDFKVTPTPTETLDLGINSVATIKSNFKYAMIETGENIKSVVMSYVGLFTGKVSISNMSGIVGIGEVVSKSQGVKNFFFLMAMISLAVGAANILPFPPLDGGKIFLVLVECIIGRKVSEKFELAVSYVGLGLLLLLTVFVTYKDIVRII